MVGVPTRLKTQEFLRRVKAALNPGGVVAFNVNHHDTMTEDIATVRSVFAHVAVYRTPPSENKVVIAADGDGPTDDDIRGRIDALDKRFAGSMSFAEVLRNRE